MIFYDFEVFAYDWLMVGIDPMKQKEYVIVNDPVYLANIYKEYKNDIWCGYNSRAYDQWILKGILSGFDPKEINDFIIIQKKKGHEFSSLLHRIRLNNYDVMPNIPVSLKVLEGFIGNNIHETSVPFDIDRKLTEQEIKETIGYCRDDVLNLIDIFIKRKSEFDSQHSLVKEFGLPLSAFGKTQAQLAATILGAKKKRFKDEWEIRLPECLDLGKYKAVGDWFLNPDNHDYDLKLTTTVGEIETVVAWGGLHAGRNQFVYQCSDDEVILDADIGQMYPNIMIHYDLQSRAVLDKDKLKLILDTSMRLKSEGKKKEREPYKRICNIVYGACGDKFNPMYDPLHRNLVCVFGQVLMIDLIDKIEHLVRCFNINTDGIFILVKKKDIPELKRIIHEWEIRTGLRMEYDEFTRFISKDVNNYIAVRANGSYHAKGAYVKELGPLDYDLPIVNEAVKRYLLFGIPVEKTILDCNELIKFQKIVRLSSKYKWVEHEIDNGIRRYEYKSYRVFATTDELCGRLLKCDGVRNPAKFGNTPDRCFIENGDVRGKSVKETSKPVDKQWYVDLAKKRISDFVGE